MRYEEVVTALPPGQAHALEEARRLAEVDSTPLWCVGGTLRDLMLGRAPADLDLVVEGDAVGFAARLASRLRGRLRARHVRFGTAVVLAADVYIDLAMARSERYPRPGALPQVLPAAIDADLARRDFTVNAIALGVAGPRAGEWLDPHGGETDLRARVLRVLHEASFRDDPTRAWRAARYVARLGVRLEPRTRARLAASVGLQAALSPARLHDELSLLLRETCWRGATRVAERWGLFEAAVPGWRLPRRLPRLPADPAARWCALLVDAPATLAERVVLRCGLARREAAAATAVANVRRALDALPDGARPSLVARALDAAPTAAVRALAPLDARAAAYLRRWHRARAPLRAEDLDALGVPASPERAALVTALRYAWIDGEASTREEAMRLARQILHGVQR